MVPDDPKATGAPLRPPQDRAEGIEPLRKRRVTAVVRLECEVGVVVRSGRGVDAPAWVGRGGRCRMPEGARQRQYLTTATLYGAHLRGGQGPRTGGTEGRRHCASERYRRPAILEHDVSNAEAADIPPSSPPPASGRTVRRQRALPQGRGLHDPSGREADRTSKAGRLHGTCGRRGTGGRRPAVPPLPPRLPGALGPAA